MGNTESSLTVKSYAGLALILSYDKFDDPRLTPRLGNEKDVSELQDVLSLLNFKTETYQNLTALQTLFKKIDEVSRDPAYSMYHKLIVIVLTHGSQDGILYASDYSFSDTSIWSDLTYPYSNFYNKPKILFFQACRGVLEEACMKSGQRLHRIGNFSSQETQYYVPSLPNHKDFFIAYSTFDNTTSIRNEITGSWYIETLCSEIKCNKSAVNLDTLLTRVNYMIVKNRSTEKFAQTPCFISFLPYELIVPPIVNTDAKETKPLPGSSSLITKLDEKKTLDKLDFEKPSTSSKQSKKCNLSNIKNVPSHYEWKHPRKGHAFIFYTFDHESEAKILQETLSSFQLEAEIHLIKQNNFILFLEEVSRRSQLEEENCILVAILTSIKLNYFENCASFIPKTWTPFIASKCSYLHDKPKIFFYFDKNDIEECMIVAQSASAEIEPPTEQVTDHVDFLHIYGFGTEYFDTLVEQLKMGYVNKNDIFEVLMKTKKLHIEKYGEKKVISKNRYSSFITKQSYFKTTFSQLFRFDNTSVQ